MKPRARGTRRAISAWLSALLLVLSVAVPFVERADLDHQQRWESTHEPGACAPAHDHTVCTQVGANLSLPARPGLPGPVLGVLDDGSLSALAHPDRRARANGNRTRAPPSV
jgi:hypothetical protein